MRILIRWADDDGHKAKVYEDSGLWYIEVKGNHKQISEIEAVEHLKKSSLQSLLKEIDTI
jgi:hypothetical protein